MKLYERSIQKRFDNARECRICLYIDSLYNENNDVEAAGWT